METTAPEEWLNYDDFAAGIDHNRIPMTEALVGQIFTITLNNDREMTLEFKEKHAVLVTVGGKAELEWCEAVEVCENTYFIDMTYKTKPTISETLIINTQTLRVLSIECNVRSSGEALGEPRVAQVYTPGTIAGGEPSGMEPAPTRDLIGLRALYRYSPNHLYEHVYISSERYSWQNLVGVQRGHGDTDMATTYQFSHNQYVFGFREFIIPVASVFFYDWDRMKSTGKFLGVTGAGDIENSQAGADIEKLSMTYYRPGEEPV